MLLDKCIGGVNFIERSALIYGTVKISLFKNPGSSLE